MQRTTPMSEYLSLFFVVVCLYFNLGAIQRTFVDDTIVGSDGIMLSFILQFIVYLISYQFFITAFKYPLIPQYRKLIRNAYATNGLLIIVLIILLRPLSLNLFVYVTLGLIELYPLKRVKMRKF